MPTCRVLKSKFRTSRALSVFGQTPPPVSRENDVRDRRIWHPLHGHPAEIFRRLQILTGRYPLGIHYQTGRADWALTTWLGVRAGRGWVAHTYRALMTNITVIGTYKAGRSSQTQLAARIPISLYKVNLSVRLGSIQKPVLRNSPVFCHVVRHVAKTISARLASSVPHLAGHLYLNYKPFAVK